MSEFLENDGSKCSVHGLVLSPHAFLTEELELPPKWKEASCLTAFNHTAPNAATPLCQGLASTHQNNPTNSILQWLPQATESDEDGTGGESGHGYTPSEGSGADSSLLGGDDLSPPASPQESGNTSQTGDEPSVDAHRTAQPTIPMIERLSRSEVVHRLTQNYLFQSKLFEVRSSLVAGLGAFAKQDLHKGDVILMEEAILTSDIQRLSADFEVLGRATKSVALQLSQNPNLKTGTPPLIAIFDTNRFATRNYENESGLFAIAARFNHACPPANNVEFRYDKQLGCIIFKMINAVQADQELTISYGADRTPFDLYNQYGFQCKCGACDGFSDEQIRELEYQNFHSKRTSW